MGNARTTEFYREVLLTLGRSRVPFVVGGAFALRHYTGLRRETKDLDLFLHERDLEPALDALGARGFATERTFPHWLAKASSGSDFVDLIFNSANGLCPVDRGWFVTAPPSTLFDVPVSLCPVEELLWTKCFVMERERFDGADVSHLLLSSTIDWKRLLERFDAQWRILYGHLLFFGFIYPRERGRIPPWVMKVLARRAAREAVAEDVNVCRGTLLSREQYLFDIQELGYADARIAPWGALESAHVDVWTEAIGKVK